MFNWLSSSIKGLSRSGSSDVNDDAGARAHAGSLGSSNLSNSTDGSKRKKLSLRPEDFMTYHREQESNWDCGLSAIIMALRWSKIEKCINMNEYYDRETPLWSIDVFTVLTKSDVFDTVEFYTTCVGVGAHHKDLDFYKPFWDDDVRRITDLFEVAKNDMPVYNASLSIEDVISILEPNTVVIALVNSSTLYLKKSDEPFSGHYIFVFHYDPSAKKFSYLDPSNSKGIQLMSVALFNASRLCFGTDEDLIICRRKVF